MMKCIESYFLLFLKPTMMILCCLSNFLYLKNSEFTSEFYFLIYIITFCLKPLFFIILFIGSIVNYRAQSLFEFILTFFIVIGIYFGFPVKEIFDYLRIEASRKFYLNLGEEYNLNEYMTTHYVVNMLVENIPITLFVLINNWMLNDKFSGRIVDPIVAHSFFGVLNGLMICGFYSSSGNFNNNNINNIHTA